MSPSKLRIVAISDTHLQHDFTLPKGDILVHAGDLTFRGDMPEMSRAINWLKAVKASHGFSEVVVICGNHDWLGEKDPSLTKSLFRDSGLIYLDHSGVSIKGINFFGSAYTPEFGGWAFNLSRMDMSLHDKWEMIPEETQVLITHGPPKGIGDLTAGYHGIEGMKEVYEPPEEVGCYDLNQRVQKLPNLKLHTFGHIHHAYGEYHRGNVTYLNASVCNEKYKPKNKPHVFDI